jgi:hypothetical protein
VALKFSHLQLEVAGNIIPNDSFGGSTNINITVNAGMGVGNG